MTPTAKANALKTDHQLAEDIALKEIERQYWEPLAILTRMAGGEQRPGCQNN